MLIYYPVLISSYLNEVCFFGIHVLAPLNSGTKYNKYYFCIEEHSMLTIMKIVHLSNENELLIIYNINENCKVFLSSAPVELSKDKLSRISTEDMSEKPLGFVRNQHVCTSLAIPPKKGACVLSCATLCHPLNCSLPGFSVHEIFQARTLEWVAIPTQGIFPTRDRTHVSCISYIGGWILYHYATWETATSLICGI